MLNIYFGDMSEAVYNTSVYFNYTYEDEWLTSDFAKEVIKNKDKKLCNIFRMQIPSVIFDKGDYKINYLIRYIGFWYITILPSTLL